MGCWKPREQLLFSHKQVMPHHNLPYVGPWECLPHDPLEWLNFHQQRHTLGDWKQQKCILLQFWRFEVQSKGVCQTMVSSKPPGDGFCFSLPGGTAVPWFVTTQLLSMPLSSPTILPVCPCVFCFLCLCHLFL